MEDDILSRRIKKTRKQSLAPYKKEFRMRGELQYDLGSRKRVKCAYSISKHDENVAAIQPSSENVAAIQPSNENVAAIQPSNENVAAIQPSTSDASVPSSSDDHIEMYPSSRPADNDINAMETQQDSESLEQVTQQTPFLAEGELYMNLLCADTKTVTISDCIGLFMVLPGLNYVKSQLKKDQLVLLERRAVSFNNEAYRWVYACSCQADWSREIRSSCCQYYISYNEFLNRFPQCIHRKVGAWIYEQNDILHQISPVDYFIANAEGSDHGYSRTEADIEEATRLDSAPVISVWDENTRSYGLVSVVKKKYFCFCCKKNFCEHSRKIKAITPESDNYIPVIEDLKKLAISENSPSSTSKNYPKCHSYKKISFFPTEQSTNCFKTGIIHNIQRHDDNLVFLPEDVVCRHCGGNLDSGDPIINQWIAGSDVTVVTNTYLGNGTVYYRPCMQCDSLTLFDGLEKCVLNMGTYLVGHDVLRSYMHSFLHGRRPLYTYYSVFVDDHGDYGNTNIMEKFSYHKLRAAWLSYLNLLDIDYTEGFSCPDCPGDSGPDIVICDGTSLSFQRRMWSWKNPELSKNNGSKKKSGFSERVFLPDQRLRTLLFRYAAGGDVLRGKHTKLLTAEEKAEMFKHLKEYPSLYIFLKSVDDGSQKLPKMFTDFVTSLSSKSPVCGYIHPCKEVHNLMEDLINGVEVKKHPQKWQQLHCEIPVLFRVLEHSDGSAAPPEIRPLLEELWELAILPFENCEQGDDSSTNFQQDEMSFFPSLPLCRPRGTYGMDITKVDKPCNKSYKGHPSLLPGVFTIYCPHGVCYGFQVMPVNESPNIPFTIFKTRFPTAPKIVVYDNACALHAYCLNRDPLFFQNTTFLVDRLHWDNHTGCSCGYCLDMYPLLTGLNSQTNEQANAGLKRIKDQLSYMTAGNFMMHCSFYLWNKNMKKKYTSVK